jgi:circadian clock protein KaiB
VDQNGHGAVDDDQLWSLRLYVSGASPRSMEAIDTVRQICDQELAGRVDLAVIDVGEQPALAVSDDVVAVPALVKLWPAPTRQLVGDLADADRVRAGLALSPVAAPWSAGEPPAVG